MSRRSSVILYSFWCCFHLVLLLGSSSVTTHAQSSIEEIGNCINAATDIASGLDCVTGFTDCFDGAAILSILNCLGDAATNAGNTESKEKAQACLAPYATCVKGEIQAILDSLPSCLNSTVVNLGTCFVTNGNTCNATCHSEVSTPSTTNPYAGVDATSLAMCNSFQSNIMDPTCDIVDCCEPCIDEMEAFMNCFVQNALDLKQADSSECVLSCATSATRSRHLLENNLQPQEQVRQLMSHGGFVNMSFTPNMVLRECGISLKTEDGLAGLKAGIEELRTRVVEGTFFQCLFDSLFDLAEKGAKEFQMNGGSPPTMAPATNTTDSAGSTTTTMIFSVIMMIMVMIGGHNMAIF